MKYVYKTALFLLLISTNVYAQQGPAQTIPEFTFFKLDKSSFTNKNLASGKMLLFVFFDSDCEHCQHAIQYINQHIGEFKKTALYLITLDSQEKINRFINTYGNNLKGQKNVALLQDLQHEFLRKFRPRKYPSIFLYSSKKELIMYDDNEQNLSGFSRQINAPGK